MHCHLQSLDSGGHKSAVLVVFKFRSVRMQLSVHSFRVFDRLMAWQNAIHHVLCHDRLGFTALPLVVLLFFLSFFGWHGIKGICDTTINQHGVLLTKAEAETCGNGGLNDTFALALAQMLLFERQQRSCMCEEHHQKPGATAGAPQVLLQTVALESFNVISFASQHSQ